MNMAPLSIFQAWVWVEVLIGKFLLDLCVKNILARKSTCSGCMLAPGWLNVLLHSEMVGIYNGLKRAGGKLEANDT